MAGTRRGGKLAALENMRKYGPDYYKRIGSLGGKKGTTGGFYANRELASIAGRKGGKISRKTKRLDSEQTRDHLDVTNERS